ncbi:MAG: hypothetical protein CMQ65_04795, partial [Gammaproteobacteria bacterium]|nr:hypothetical protein [Gammaproteobacteria bacterium]
KEKILRKKTQKKLKISKKTSIKFNFHEKNVKKTRKKKILRKKTQKKLKISKKTLIKFNFHEKKR